MPVKKAGGGWRSFSEYNQELLLVSLEDGATQVVRGSGVHAGYNFVDWSPSGDDVFLTGGDFEVPREIVHYRLGEDQAERLDVRVDRFYDMAVG